MSMPVVGQLDILEKRDAWPLARGSVAEPPAIQDIAPLRFVSRPLAAPASGRRVASHLSPFSECLSECGARRHLWATWVVHVDPSHGAVRNDLNCDIFRLGARLVNHVVYVPAADVDFCHANKPSTGGEGPRVAAPTPTASWDRLEVVLRHVVDDLPAEDLRLYVGSPEVQARPDAGVDDLLESV